MKPLPSRAVSRDSSRRVSVGFIDAPSCSPSRARLHEVASGTARNVPHNLSRPTPHPRPICRDREARTLVDELYGRSREFAQLWDQHEVAVIMNWPKRIRQAAVGVISLDSEVLSSQ